MKRTNRWVYAFVGVAALLLCGMIYAWSVISIPIGREFAGWSKAELSMTFTVVMILFCIGGLVGGALSAQVSQKIYLWTAAGMFAAGFFLAAGAESPITMYIGFGVICGFASGISYNAVLGSITPWFPDKQGLISGVLLMGFGLSSFIIGKLFQAFTPDTIGAWRDSFKIMGMIMAVVLTICGFLLKKPSEEEKKALAALKKADASSGSAGLLGELTAGKMIRTPTFCLFYIWAITLSIAGLALVSQASGMAIEIGKNISGSTIATVVGLISVFNGIGRVLFGGLFDRAGRGITMQTACAAYFMTGLILTAAFFMQSFLLVIVGFCAGGLAYASVTPTGSAFTLSYYGTKNYQMNISVINTSLIISSFGSTIAGAVYDSTQSYISIYIMICTLALIGSVLSLGIGIFDKKIKKIR